MREMTVDWNTPTFACCECWAAVRSEWFQIQRLTDPLWQFIEAKEQRSSSYCCCFSQHGRPTGTTVTSQKGGSPNGQRSGNMQRERERERKERRENERISRHHPGADLFLKIYKGTHYWKWMEESRMDGQRPTLTRGTEIYAHSTRIKQIPFILFINAHNSEPPKRVVPARRGRLCCPAVFSDSIDCPHTKWTTTRRKQRQST